MKKYNNVIAGCLLVVSACLLDAGVPVKTIFDTDMCSDNDDVGALSVLNKLSDNGEAEILACVVNSRNRDKSSAAAISVINTYYGRPGIPIGTYQGTSAREGASAYTSALRDEFPHKAPPDDQEPTGWSVYRTALAAAPDGSVTIISVGFFGNLADLLQSKPDAISPLDGAALVRAKVKQLVVMGGAFPKSDPIDPEFNFGWNSPLDTKYVVDNWPTPILFSGFEIGAGCMTGKPLAATPATNPVRRAYELRKQFQTGRDSWDLTAVLAAVRDPHLYWDVSPSGTCKVSIIGTDKWVPTPDRGHSYLIAKVPKEELAKVLDDLMVLPPGMDKSEK